MIAHAQPDRRHAHRHGHAFGRDQPGQAGAVHLTAGQNHLGPRRRQGEGQAPGVGVEQGHDRHHHIHAAQGQHVGLQQLPGVQEAGAVGVGHPLGHPRGAGGEAQARRRVLIEPAPAHIHRGVGDQGLDRLDADARVSQVRRAVDDEDLLDAQRPVRHLHGQRHQIGADEDDARFGLIQHPGQLFGRQARVQGVAHRPHAHDGVPGLDVRLGVPRQSRHTAADVDAQPFQDAGDLQAALAQVGIGDAGVVLPLTGCDHLGRRMPFGGVLDDLIER
ncbi:hypothetical protein ACMZ4W_02250 [Brevundimonas naejangsanensis]